MDLKTALGGGICLRAYIHPRSVECDHLSSPVETARHADDQRAVAGYRSSGALMALHLQHERTHANTKAPPRSLPDLLAANYLVEALTGITNGGSGPLSLKDRRQIVANAIADQS
jgi:hypothetical protein